MRPQVPLNKSAHLHVNYFYAISLNLTQNSISVVEWLTGVWLKKSQTQWVIFCCNLLDGVQSTVEKYIEGLQIVCLLQWVDIDPTSFSLKPFSGWCLKWIYSGRSCIRITIWRCTNGRYVQRWLQTIKRWIRNKLIGFPTHVHIVTASQKYEQRFHGLRIRKYNSLPQHLTCSKPITPGISYNRNKYPTTTLRNYVKGM